MEETIKLENRWIVLYELHKPPDIVELDFKLFHNTIFTYEKLFKIGKTESNLCPICLTKDILYNVKNYKILEKKCFLSFRIIILHTALQGKYI